MQLKIEPVKKIGNTLRTAVQKKCTKNVAKKQQRFIYPNYFQNNYLTLSTTLAILTNWLSKEDFTKIEELKKEYSRTTKEELISKKQNLTKKYLKFFKRMGLKTLDEDPINNTNNSESVNPKKKDITEDKKTTYYLFDSSKISSTLQKKMKGILLIKS